MNSRIFPQLLRFIFIVLLQVLIFKRLSFSMGGANYMTVMIYPIFIFLLPHKIPHSLLVFLGFVLGLTIDVFYDSPGIHASAAVFTAFARPLVLRIFEPRGGYKMNLSPSKREMGINNFTFYAATLLAGHLLFYFIMESFSLVYLGESLLRTIVSFFPSLVFVIIYQYIFDPKD